MSEATKRARITFRVSEPERRDTEAAAVCQNVNMSEFIRNVVSAAVARILEADAGGVGVT